MKEGDRSGFPKAAPTSWKMSVAGTGEQRMDCAKLVEQSALGVIEPPQHGALHEHFIVHGALVGEHAPLLLGEVFESKAAHHRASDHPLTIDS
jgi:hypothetical protein